MRFVCSNAHMHRCRYIACVRLHMSACMWMHAPICLCSLCCQALRACTCMRIAPGYMCKRASTQTCQCSNIDVRVCTPTHMFTRTCAKCTNARACAHAQQAHDTCNDKYARANTFNCVRADTCAAHLLVFALAHTHVLLTAQTFVCAHSHVQAHVCMCMRAQTCVVARIHMQMCMHTIMCQHPQGSVHTQMRMRTPS